MTFREQKKKKPKARRPTLKSEHFLEQYDHVFGEYLEKVEKRYTPHIGLFLIRFSALEHALDIRVAECLSDRAHAYGYVIIEGMSLHLKIDLFRKLFKGHVKGLQPKRVAKHAAALDILLQRLDAARVFRNYVAHANWSTLERSGYVRTKIEEKEGQIVFKKVRITPDVLKAWTRRVVHLEIRLGEFVDNFWDADNLWDVLAVRS